MTCPAAGAYRPRTTSGQEIPVPVHRSLEQQREQALRRALDAKPRKPPVSDDTIRRAMAAFDVRQAHDAPMAQAIQGILKQYPVAKQVQVRRHHGKDRPDLWLILGVTCGLTAAVLLTHSTAWCATFATFGLASTLYGITQHPPREVSGIPANDRDDWGRAGARYDQAWAIAHARALPAAVQQRLHALHATLLRLLPLALNPASLTWSLQDRVGLEAIVGEYVPEAVHGYTALTQPTEEGLMLLERQLDGLQERLATLERTVNQRGHQRQRAHERFLNHEQDSSEHHL